MSAEIKIISKASISIIVIAVCLFLVMMWVMRTNIPGEEQLLEAVKQAEQIHGPEDQKMGTVLSLTAAKYQLAGYPNKAINIYKRIVQIDEKASGKESAIVVSSKHQLAKLYDEVDSIDQSNAIYKEICEVEKRLIQQTVKTKGSGNSKNGKNNYRPTIRPWLKARVAQLKESGYEPDRILLSRYQKRLEICQAEKKQ